MEICKDVTDITKVGDFIYFGTYSLCINIKQSFFLFLRISLYSDMK